MTLQAVFGLGDLDVGWSVFGVMFLRFKADGRFAPGLLAAVVQLGAMYGF